MKQRVTFAAAVEIPAVLIEQDVRHEQDRGHDGLPGRSHFRRKIQQDSGNAADREHGEKRRENPSYPPVVEFENAVAAAIHVAEDDRTDEVAGDDEEDIDTDEATTDIVRQYLEVKQQDRT